MRTHQEKQQEAKDNRNAAFLSIGIVGAVIALLLIFTAFVVPDPPYEEPEVVILDFSEAAAGGGSMSTDDASSSQEDTEVTDPVTPQETNADVESVTEDTPEVPVDAADDVSDSPVEDPREVDPSSLFPGDAGTSNQDGGGGGTGDGDGGGSGNTTGAGAGDFGNGDFNLAGRGIVKKPTLSGSFAEEGIVVVDIFVDRMGNVVSAKINRMKSDIGNQAQLDKAIRAAKRAKFTPEPGAAVEQKGSITFRFKKN